MIKAIALAGAGGLLLGVIYLYGILFEHEYPHWFLLRRVSQATSPTGTPVREILRDEFGKDAEKVDWHTCGYCMDRPGQPDGAVRVQFRSPVDGQTIYHFHYDEERHQLTPADSDTAARFPGLRKMG